MLTAHIRSPKRLYGLKLYILASPLVAAILVGEIALISLLKYAPLSDLENRILLTGVLGAYTGFAFKASVPYLSRFLSESSQSEKSLQSYPPLSNRFYYGRA